jgi:hypothetical protein
MAIASFRDALLEQRFEVSIAGDAGDCPLTGPAVA